MTTNAPVAIEARGVRKRFGKVDALNGVDLSVVAGTVYALMGPNGAGKTTLIRSILGLVRPAAGRIVVLGPIAFHLLSRPIAKQVVGFDMPIDDVVEELTASILEGLRA